MHHLILKTFGAGSTRARPARPRRAWRRVLMRAAARRQQCQRPAPVAVFCARRRVAGRARISPQAAGISGSARGAFDAGGRRLLEPDLREAARPQRQAARAASRSRSTITCWTQPPLYTGPKRPVESGAGGNAGARRAAQADSGGRRSPAARRRSSTSSRRSARRARSSSSAPMRATRSPRG